MCYVKAVLDELSKHGIAETQLSVRNFVAIAEWEKQEIPIDLIRTKILEIGDSLPEKSVEIIFERFEAALEDEVELLLAKPIEKQLSVSG